MPSLTEAQIKDIAENLDIGFRSFWHKPTGELLFVPDFDGMGFIDQEFWEDDLEKLEKDFADYFEIEKPYSSYSFDIMANFTEGLEDNTRLKRDLIEALNRKKPFKGFKIIIDNSDFREDWFKFKNAQIMKWVVERFEAATFEEDETDLQDSEA